MRLLIIEDEYELRQMLEKGLRMAGYETDSCGNGAEGLELALCEAYDLILLDLNLPGLDGMELLRALRRENEEVRVLILSARDSLSDKISGLDSGANDFLTKPFHFEELEARIRSLTRRRFLQQNVNLIYGELHFDTLTRIASVNGSPLPLTRKETGILEYLLLNRHRIISQEELMEHIWDGSVNEFSNSTRVHISSLRKKLRAALGYDPVVNRIGQGYHLKEDSNA
ncbi:MAG: response regulator transcription factor [Eubacteriales bacterium]|nr:response regulator transcription factor [Eubacteriales bacterium]